MGSLEESSSQTREVEWQSPEAGAGGMEELGGHRAPVLHESLKTDAGDGCTTVQMDLLAPLTYPLRNGQMVNILLYGFYHDFLNWKTSQSGGQASPGPNTPWQQGSITGHPSPRAGAYC